MNDRFLCGFIAGFIADVFKNGLNFFSYYILHFSKIRYLDFAGVILTAHRPENLIEEIIALIAEFFWASLLGAVFAHLIMYSPKNYLFKSTIYGLSVWFTVYAIVTLFKIPLLTGNDINSVISNLLTSAVYGYSLGLIFEKFEKKYHL